ncbi:unnamed protein product, partial [Effrenium voratum]
QDMTISGGDSCHRVRRLHVSSGSGSASVVAHLEEGCSEESAQWLTHSLRPSQAVRLQQDCPPHVAPCNTDSLDLAVTSSATCSADGVLVFDTSDQPRCKLLRSELRLIDGRGRCFPVAFSNVSLVPGLDATSVRLVPEGSNLSC